MAIKDYSTTPDLNTQISGINIAEGCAPSGINNAIRQLMADVKAENEATQATQASQAAKDAAQDAAITGKLDKSGGEMTGSISMTGWASILFGNNANIYTIDDDGTFTIHGGTQWDKCPRTSWAGIDSPGNAGDWVTYGYNPVNGALTALRVDASEGNVKVNDRVVILTVNDQNADANGRVSIEHVSSSGWADRAGYANLAEQVTTTPNVFTQWNTADPITLPSGGTWALVHGSWSGGAGVTACYTSPGGAVITKYSGHSTQSIFAIRIA